MIRTQIQLPEPLYREIKRIARDQDWSLAEVIRRGAEAVVRSYPDGKRQAEAGPKLPPPIQAKLRIEDPEELKALISRDWDFAESGIR